MYFLDIFGLFEISKHLQGMIEKHYKNFGVGSALWHSYRSVPVVSLVYFFTVHFDLLFNELCVAFDSIDV